MAYIGAQPQVGSYKFLIDSFTGDAINTDFTLSVVPPTKNSMGITIDGIWQHIDAYDIVGNVLKFTEIPELGVSIEVLHLGTRLETAHPAADSVGDAELKATDIIDRDRVRSDAALLMTDIRQTVHTGRVDVNGLANFLEAGVGLDVNLKATTDPIVFSLSNGYDKKGPIEYQDEILADIGSVWSGLTASTTNYLYIDRNSSTGVLTYGFTVIEPVYETVYVSTTTDEHWFDLSKFKMKVWNGASWDEKQRIFVGEAVTDGSTVTSLITYALRGQYDSGGFDVSAGIKYTKNHNIGLDDVSVKALARQDSSFKWGVIDMQYISSNNSYYGGSRALDRLVAILDFDTTATDYIGDKNTSGDDSFTATQSTTGQARLIVKRGW